MPAMWPTCLTRRKQPSLLKRRRRPRQPVSEAATRRESRLISSFAPPELSQFKCQLTRLPSIGKRLVCKAIDQEGDMENQLVIKSPDGTFNAHVSRPAKLPASVVVVLQELFGVNA